MLAVLGAVLGSCEGGSGLWARNPVERASSRGDERSAAPIEPYPRDVHTVIHGVVTRDRASIRRYFTKLARSTPSPPQMHKCGVAV